MSKINKLLLAVLLIIILSLTILTRSRKDGRAEKIIENKKLQETFTSQENESGNVTVTVKPKTLKVGERPVFELEFETHSVDLDFDVAKQSSLVDDKGKKIAGAVWDGSPPGGHHRSGTLSFNNSLTQTNYVELIIKNIAGVLERKFRWEL